VLAIETSAIRKAKAIKKNVTPVVNEDGGDNDGDEDKPAERSSGSAGGLFTTGLMRESMKESTEIAYINARHTLQKMDPGNTFFEDNQVHLHVPTGNPKDGPSAGITMTSALLSLALNKAVPLTTSMTGEITLGGYVLAVGGIKDKLLAARRQGITRLILPKLCKDTFEELAPHLKEGIEVHFVDKYSQVYDIVFGAK
jgi:Lon-like ATP-dependent protease